MYGYRRDNYRCIQGVSKVLAPILIEPRKKLRNQRIINRVAKMVISKLFLDNLVSSMPNRIRKVLELKGHLYWQLKFIVNGIQHVFYVVLYTAWTKVFVRPNIDHTNSYNTKLFSESRAFNL